MGDRQEWPPTQRHLARFLHAVTYAAGAGAGLGILAHTPATVANELGQGWITVLGLMALIGGGIGLVATIAHRWMIEWPAAWIIGGAFTAYAALEWTLVLGDGYLPRIATALVLTVGAGAFLARAVDLWVFSLHARNARVARVKAWRKVAKQAGVLPDGAPR